MKRIAAIVSLSLLFYACQKEQKPVEYTPDYSSIFLVDEVPGKTPLRYLESLVPDSLLVHQGVFSPDLTEYYFTLSDFAFQNFTVKMVKKIDGAWSEPEDAFFNSEYDDHGVSFAEDGKHLYFSSTRPVAPIKGDSVAATWHIWRTENVDGQWSEPQYIDIPNMRDRLVSHASLSDSGRMYFHSSKLDYSEMTLYYADQKDGKFQDAEIVRFPWFMTAPKSTPYIAPDESYLLYASVERNLYMTVCFPDGKGNWIGAKKLHPSINANNQGNPYVTPDGKFMFYVGNENNVHEIPKWRVKWVSMDAVPKEPQVAK